MNLKETKPNKVNPSTEKLGNAVKNVLNPESLRIINQSENLCDSVTLFRKKNMVICGTEKTIVNARSNSNNVIKLANTQYPPNFPNSLYTSLPNFFKRIIKHTDDNDEKDTLLLSSIVTTGSCLTNIYGVYHDMKLHPNLNLFLSGSAASGKGRIRYSKKLVEPIHREKREQTLKEKEEYNTVNYSIEDSKKENKGTKKVKAVPTQKMLFIPGNATSSRVQEILHNNDAIGLIFETEGDVMVNSFKSEYGDYSTVFRQAFHHEQISLTRKGNDEHIEITDPKLSVVLSGTPLQLKGLIPNAENGLFSRFIFYKLKTKTEWVNVFGNKVKGGLNNYFESLGSEFYSMYKLLEGLEEVEFTFTKEQQQEFNAFFTKNSKKYEALLGIDFLSILRRTGVIAFRIAMILSFFRTQEKKKSGSEIICEDIDFKNAMLIIDTLLNHSAVIFSQTPKAPKSRVVKTRSQQLLDLVPAEFNRQDFYACALKLNISNKSADKFINKLLKSNWLQKRAHNDYINAAKFKSNVESIN